MHPAIASATVPGYGESMAAWARTPFGALQRLALRSMLLFASPGRIPREWTVDQYALARAPGVLAKTLRFVRTQVMRRASA